MSDLERSVPDTAPSTSASCVSCSPGYVINSKQHVPSAIYIETEIHRLTLASQSPIDLAAGQGKFHQSVTHTHVQVLIEA